MNANQSRDMEVGELQETHMAADDYVQEEEQDEAIHVGDDANFGVFSTDTVRNGAWFTMLTGHDVGVTNFILVSRDLATLIVASSPPPALLDAIEIPLELVSDVSILGLEDLESSQTVIISLGDHELRVMAQSAEIAEEWVISLGKLALKAQNERPLNSKRKRNMRKHVADAMEAPGRMHTGWKVLMGVLGLLAIIIGIVLLVVYG